MTKQTQSHRKPARGQTGPKSSQGKITSSRNATKTGLHVSGWIDSIEESEYQDLFNNLRLEYNAQNTTLLLQIERMATTMVKMRRLQKIESALFQKARGLAEIRAQERQSIPSIASKHPEHALMIAQLSAIPDMDRLATLQRYQTSLDRQLSKILGEIRILTLNTSSANSNVIESESKKSLNITLPLK